MIFNDNNVAWMKENSGYNKFDLIYGDCIYESLDFEWVIEGWKLLKEGGIWITQTDQSTVCEHKLLLDSLGGNLINWCIYVQEWGGTSKRFFSKKHDDILIYSKGSNYKFYYDRIMIPKKTAGTKFDKRGDGLKIPCDVFYDLGNFSTIAKERIKNNNGKNIQWQKPMKLMDRLLSPFTDENDWILDPFLGSGTTGEWCRLNNRNFIGIEYDEEVFGIAKRRLNE